MDVDVALNADMAKIKLLQTLSTVHLVLQMEHLTGLGQDACGCVQLEADNAGV
jgi:hypothetical protein